MFISFTMNEGILYTSNVLAAYICHVCIGHHVGQGIGSELKYEPCIFDM